MLGVSLHERRRQSWLDPHPPSYVGSRMGPWGVFSPVWGEGARLPPCVGSWTPPAYLIFSTNDWTLDRRETNIVGPSVRRIFQAHDCDLWDRNIDLGYSAAPFRASQWDHHSHWSVGQPLLVTTSSITRCTAVGYLAKTSMVPVNFSGQGQDPLKTLSHHLLSAVVAWLSHPLVTWCPSVYAFDFKRTLFKSFAILKARRLRRQMPDLWLANAILPLRVRAGSYSLGRTWIVRTVYLPRRLSNLISVSCIPNS